MIIFSISLALFIIFKKVNSLSVKMSVEFIGARNQNRTFFFTKHHEKTFERNDDAVGVITIKVRASRTNEST